MRIRHIWTATTIAAVVALAAGCGSGGGTSSTTAATTTTQATTASVDPAFKAHYEAVILQMKSSAIKMIDAVKQAPTEAAAQVSATFSGLTNIWEDDLAGLKKLTPPSNLTGDFGAVSSAADAVDVDLRGIVSAADANDTQAAKSAALALLRDLGRTKSAAVMLERALGTGSAG